MQLLWIFILILQLSLPTWAAAFRTIDGQAMSQARAGENLLKNGHFEKNTANWTASAGTYARTTTASEIGQGVASGSWDAGATGQYLTSTAVTIPNGMYGTDGAAMCWFKTTATDYLLQAYDGTNILGSVTIPSSTVFTPVSVNYPNPSSGSISLRLASQSDAAEIDFDECWQGKARDLNLSQVSQATYYGSITWAATTNCVWASSSTSMAAFAADADCPSPTVTGSVTAPATKIPGAVLTGPGEFEIHMQGGRWLTSSVADGSTSIKFSNGTISSTGHFILPVDASGHSQNWVTSASFNVTLTDATPVTLSLYTDTASDISLSNIFTAQDSSGLNFKIYRFPTLSQTAYTADQAAWRVDANISGANPSLGTSNQSSYVGIENGSLTLTQNTGSITAWIPCSSTNDSSGATCSSGNESLGVSFTVPKAGAVLACASFSHQVNDAGSGTNADVDAAFQIVETPNAAQTISQEGKSRVNSRFTTNSAGGGEVIVSTLPHRLCGTFEFSSAGRKTLRLMYEQAVGGTISSNAIIGDAASSVGQRDIHWEVYPINQQSPAPLLVNSVVSSYAGVMKQNIAKLNCDAASSITSNPGSWISSIGNISLGSCTVTLTTGIFSAAPYCVLGGYNTDTDPPGISAKPTGATTVVLDCANGTTDCTEYDLTLMCLEPQ